MAAQGNIGHSEALLRKALEKHSKAERLFFEGEDIRWATPEIVADYRAERLKCKTIADIGCGIGFQAIAFAKACKKVYAVEKDERKIKYAKLNAEALGIKNMTFIHGDALDEEVKEKIKDSEIIFCDPERPPEEGERRIESINPGVNKLLKLYSSVTDKIAIEFPPQIKKTPEGCEKEYLSVDGRANRLTLYFGSLARSNVSAVVLPQEAELRGDKAAKPKKSLPLLKYLYEIDSSASKAGLIPELVKETGADFFKEEKQAFLTSASLIKSPFFRNAFEVLGVCDFKEDEIADCLAKNNAGKVVLRFNIDPKDYWDVRRRYESRLCGEDKLCLFRFDEKAVVAKLILAIDL